MFWCVDGWYVDDVGIFEMVDCFCIGVVFVVDCVQLVFDCEIDYLCGVFLEYMEVDVEWLICQ